MNGRFVRGQIGFYFYEDTVDEEVRRVAVINLDMT